MFSHRPSQARRHAVHNRTHAFAVALTKGGHTEDGSEDGHDFWAQTCTRHACESNLASGRVRAARAGAVPRRRGSGGELGSCSRPDLGDLVTRGLGMPVPVSVSVSVTADNNDERVYSVDPPLRERKWGR